MLSSPKRGKKKKKNSPTNEKETAYTKTSHGSAIVLVKKIAQRINFAGINPELFNQIICKGSTILFNNSKLRNIYSHPDNNRKEERRAKEETSNILPAFLGDTQAEGVKSVIEICGRIGNQ